MVFIVLESSYFKMYDSMIWLSEKIEFPSHQNTTKDGIIALGGDLSPDRLIHAYKHGIFPWYSENELLYGIVRIKEWFCSLMI